jgi:hypothetical protein
MSRTGYSSSKEGGGRSSGPGAVPELERLKLPMDIESSSSRKEIGVCGDAGGGSSVGSPGRERRSSSLFNIKGSPGSL